MSIRERCKLIEKKSHAMVPFHALVDHPHCTMEDDGLLLHDFKGWMWDNTAPEGTMRLITTGETIKLSWKFYMSIITMHLFSGIDNMSEDGYIKDYYNALQDTTKKNNARETPQQEIFLTQVHDFVSIPGLKERRQNLWMQLGTSNADHFFGLKMFRSTDYGYSDITHLFVKEFAAAWEQNKLNNLILSDKKNGKYIFHKFNF